MATKQPKPTKQQLAQAKLRAAASGIKMDQSAKGLRNAGKAIIAGASLLPAGRGVKAAATAAKAVKVAKVAKTASKAKEAAKTSKIASNSVRVRPEDSTLRLRKNVDSYYKTVKAKSGAAAKEGASKVDITKSMGSKLPKKDFTISDNVKIKVPTTPSGKQTLNSGTVQVMRENIRTMGKTTKAESKANARALKAANKKKSK